MLVWVNAFENNGQFKVSRVTRVHKTMTESGICLKQVNNLIIMTNLECHSFLFCSWWMYNKSSIYSVPLAATDSCVFPTESLTLSSCVPVQGLPSLTDVVYEGQAALGTVKWDGLAADEFHLLFRPLPLHHGAVSLWPHNTDSWRCVV